MKTEHPHALEFSQEQQSEELLPELSISIKEARAKTTHFEAHVATFYSTIDHDRQSRLLTDDRNYPLEYNYAGRTWYLSSCEHAFGKGPQFSEQEGRIFVCYSTNYAFNAMVCGHSPPDS